MEQQLKLEEVEPKIHRLTGITHKVYAILKNNPELRGSDKAVAWAYWYKYGKCNLVTRDGEPEWVINKALFLKNTSQETITRACRKVRELYPELAGTKKVRHARAQEEIEFSRVFKHMEV